MTKIIKGKKAVCKYFKMKEISALCHDYDKIPTHQENISCPTCHTIQQATVRHTISYWSYIQLCRNCGTWIGESEWIKI